MPLTNAEIQKQSRGRRALAYQIIKRQAQEAGYMKDSHDVDGLDKYLSAQLDGPADTGNK